MSSTRRIQDIERLRAIAAVSVVIGHVPWFYVGLTQLFGVRFDPTSFFDLFFVISGFVVSSAFERDLTRADRTPTPGVALRTFYRKRAARILPTAYIAVAMWWVGVTWFNESGTWGQPLHGRDAAAMVASALLLISNYTEPFLGVQMPLFWLWSTCVEEHFYLLYPSLRLLVGGIRGRCAAVLALIIVVHLARALSGLAIVQIDSLSHMRFDQLGLGVLLGLARQRWPMLAATATHRLRSNRGTRLLTLLVLLVLLVLLGSMHVSALNQTPFGYDVRGALALCIVMIASCDAELLGFGRSGIGRVLSLLGARSYGIYMFHMLSLWIVVELRHRTMADPTAHWLRAPEVIAYLIVFAAVVELNYRWVERPLIGWAARDRAVVTVA